MRQLSTDFYFQALLFIQLFIPAGQTVTHSLYCFPELHQLSRLSISASNPVNPPAPPDRLTFSKATVDRFNLFAAWFTYSSL